MSVTASKNSGSITLSNNCVATAVSLLVSIVETACEHESDLELMRLVNFMDLYRTYLAHANAPAQAGDQQMNGEVATSALEPNLGTTDCASFEQFISDSRLLEMAAAAAAQECGLSVATPPPLKLSANASLV